MSGINKSHGVEVGDNVIRNVADICCKEPEKLLSGTMGDDTLFIIYTKMSEKKAKTTSESLIQKISNHGWELIANGLFITCSIGFVEFSDLELADDALMRAIEGLINARKKGGNQADTVLLKQELTKFNLIIKREFAEENEIERSNRWLSMVS